MIDGNADKKQAGLWMGGWLPVGNNV